MTTKNWKKAFSQLKAKPAKMKKYLKHNSPKKRTTGMGLFACERCGRFGGHVGKYDLHLCRCCFRDIATKIGFEQYS